MPKMAAAGKRRRSAIWLSAKGVALLAIAAALQACAGASRQHTASPEPEGPPSRQISTCQYEIQFNRGRGDLGPSARSTISAAVASHAVRAPRSPFIITTRGSGAEGGKVMQARRDSIWNELRTLGLRRGSITSTQVFPPMDGPDDVQENWTANLRVCGDLSDEELRALPEPSVTAVRSVLVGNVRLDIPLRLLPRNHWVDIPLTPVGGDSQALLLSWPGLRRSSDYNDCRDARSCDERIVIRLRRPPLIGRDPGLEAPAWSTSDLQPIPGHWNGLRFYRDAHAVTSVSRVFFVGIGERPTVSGICSLARSLPGGVTATSVGAALMDGRHCQFTPYFGPADVMIQIQTHSRYMAEWQSIRLETERLVTGFRPASAN